MSARSRLILQKALQIGKPTDPLNPNNNDNTVKINPKISDYLLEDNPTDHSNTNNNDNSVQINPQISDDLLEGKESTSQPGQASSSSVLEGRS